MIVGMEERSEMSGEGEGEGARKRRGVTRLMTFACAVLRADTILLFSRGPRWVLVVC